LVVPIAVVSDKQHAQEHIPVTLHLEVDNFWVMKAFVLFAWRGEPKFKQLHFCNKGTMVCSQFKANGVKVGYTL
jgi:hypothetical protein